MMIALLTMVVLTAAFVLFLAYYESDVRSDARSHTGNFLDPHWDAFSRAWDRRVLLLEGLRAFAESNLDGSTCEMGEKYPQFAAVLHRQVDGIRGFAVAPGGVVAFVYPFQGNEMLIGHNLLGDQRPGAGAAVARTLASGEIALAGPYTQASGGEPTFEAFGAIRGRDGFWGMVSSTIDVRPMLKISGFDDLSQRLAVAFRSLDGTVFWGDPAVFRNDPVIRRLEGFGQILEVGALPVGGWRAAVQPQLAAVYAVGILGIFGVTGAIFLFASRHSGLARTIRLRTAELALSDERFQESEKRAEKALRASEEQLRLALLGTKDGLWDWDIQTDYVFFSPRWKSMLGYTEDELENHFDTWKSLVHPEDLPRTIAATRDLVAQRTDEFAVEFRMKHKNGYYRDILSRAFLVRNSQGEAVRLVGTHVDITERKRAEEALADREAKLWSIFSAASVGIGLTVDRVFQEVNDSLCRMTGYSREELIGQGVLMLYATEEDYRIIGDVRRLQIAECGMANIETRWRTKDGAVREIALSTTPFDIHDLAKGNIFTALDITERKHAELALRESEYFLRRSQEVAHVGSFYVDMRTGDWISSKTMDELIGLKGSYPGNLRDWLKLIHPANRLEFMRYWKELVLGGRTTFDREFRIVRQNDRQERWVHGLGELQFDKNGRLEKMIGTAQDITERKCAEEALKMSQALLDKAQRLTHFGGWEMSLAELTLNCSDEIFRIFGVPIRDSQPDLPEFFRMVHPDDKPMVLEHYRESVETGKFRSYEYRIVRPDGSVRWVHSTGEADLNEEGVPVQIIGTLHDITDRKREQEEKEKLETQLVQAQKMESIGRLAGGVAHDFNNMLSVILGCTELIKARAVLDGPVSGYLQEITKAANRSRDITRQLLAFSRKQIIAPKTLKLNEHIHETRKILSRMIGEDLHLSFQPGKDLWTIKLDPFQLDQILMNLIVNARDAMPDGGTATIKTANVIIDTNSLEKHYFLTPGEYVVLEITDEGSGMDQETLRHMFEPFFTTKKLGQGTGLGLATVYGIVKQNNGFINAYSEPGEGTCFRVYFPRATGEEIAPAPEEAQGLEGSETVLVVEDSKPVCELIAGILKEIGFTVLVAETPAEALALCEKLDIPIDILVTDVIMPNMNGVELGNKVAAMRPGIKILFMSGYPEDFIAHRGVLKKEVHFIQKPFSMKDIADKIREIMREEIQESE